MIVHQDFRDSTLPPKMYMIQIMNDLLKVYCHLWEHKDNRNMFTCTWKEIAKIFSVKTFRTALRKLNEHGLINWTHSETEVAIEIIGWDD